MSDQLIQIGRSIEEARSFEAVKEFTDEPQQAEKEMFKLRAELAAIGEIDENLIKEAKEVDDHYNFLTTQSVDLGKASVDFKKFNRRFKRKNSY